MEFTRITVNVDQMDGVPCIRELPIPVETVVGMIADGMTDEEILRKYPDLELEDIWEALLFHLTDGGNRLDKVLAEALAKKRKPGEVEALIEEAREDFFGTR